MIDGSKIHDGFMNRDKNVQRTLQQLVADRRAVLRSVGVGGSAVVTAVAVAACGNSSDGGSGAAAATTDSGASAAPGSSTTAGTSGGGAVKATVATSKVPVGGGVILDQKYVVTQPTAGSYKAFSAICTHQGCPVTSVDDGLIKCPCHSSHFSITDGSVQAGPATEPLPSFTATVEGSDVDVT